jgi:hypothetical protein
MPGSSLGECVTDPICAYWHCQLEINSEEKPAAQSPQTSPGEGLQNMSGLLLRLQKLVWTRAKLMTELTFLKMQLIVRRAPRS